MQKQYDAVIIGAGVIGANIALELSRRGWKTLNVDRGPGAGHGSTSNSCSIVRTYYSTFEGCAMAWEGYHYWRDWEQYLGAADESGFARFVDCGTLIIRTGQNRYLKPILEMADALGIPYEEWDNARIAERMPAWDLRQFGPPKPVDDPHFGEPTSDAIAGAVFFPCGGYVDDPQLSVHNLQRAAEAAGATFRFRSTVTAIPRENGRVAGVELDGGERIPAPVVVNVAGPHSARVNDLAGLTGTMRITTRALRHEVPYVPIQGEFEHSSGVVTSDSDVAAYSRPAPGNRILIGSEDPPCDGHQWVDPDDFDRNLSDRGRTQVMRLAQRMPNLGIPDSIQGVVDLYDVTDDWIPIYDRTDLPGFYVAIGTSGNQYKNASVAGALMAELIEYCEAGNDHDTEPMIFRLKYIGRDLDTGFFSRNREINPNSSFSVLG